LIARSRAAVDFGVSSLTTLGALYTIDCIFRDIGLDPVFLPLLKRSLTNSSDLVENSTVVYEREHKVLMEALKQVHKRQLCVKEDDKIYQSFLDSTFISRDEMMELQRELQTKIEDIEKDKQALLKKINDNLEKGYGSLEGTALQGLTDKNNSKILEALKEETGNLTGDLFPKLPEEKAGSSTILKALKESGLLTEEIFPKIPEEKPCSSSELRVQA
jgi:hypothetical protein